MTDHSRVFAPQYRARSGPGSTPEATSAYRAFLARYIAQNNVQSILDLGCGDLEVMSRLDELAEVDYLGVDVIAARIAENRRKHPLLTFEVADIRERWIEAVDLVIVKDVLQHWTTAEVTSWIGKLLASQAKAALITNCHFGPGVNKDIRTGGWRPIDLTAPPFSIGRVVFQWEPQLGRNKDVVLVELPALKRDIAG